MNTKFMFRVLFGTSIHMISGGKYMLSQYHFRLLPSTFVIFINHTTRLRKILNYAVEIMTWATKQKRLRDVSIANSAVVLLTPQLCGLGFVYLEPLSVEKLKLYILRSQHVISIFEHYIIIPPSCWH